MGIPSEAEMRRRMAGTHGVPKSTAGLTFLRVNPDTGETARVRRDDDRYDMWLTAAQWRAQSGGGAPATGVLSGIGGAVGKGLATAVGVPTGTGKRAVSAAKKRAAALGKVAASGAKVAVKGLAPALPLIAAAALAIGAVWYLRRNEGKARMQAWIRARLTEQAKHIGRPLTQDEIESLLPAYEHYWRTR